MISPFVDSQTNAVIYLDFSSIDMNAVDAWQQKAIAAIPDPADRAKQQQDARLGSPGRKNGFPISKPPGGRICTLWFRWAG